MTNAIETRSLTKSYGPQRGVFDLTLSVTEGEVFGFLGPNGAGKTTTIRLLLDLIRPSGGSASVFGLDCQKDAPAVHRLIGYLPGEFSLDPRLTGRELLTYLANLRGGVDWSYVEELAKLLDLDLSRPFSDYSRGNKQKVGLVQAFMHRPRLLILDEPSGGLDPLNQESVLELVQRANQVGSTVFFSSHILSEVQKVCQRVAFIREGRLIRLSSIEELLESTALSVEVDCQRAPEAGDIAALAGASRVEVKGTHASLFWQGDMQPLLAALAPCGVRRILSSEPSLTEVFLGLYEGEG